MRVLRYDPEGDPKAARRVVSQAIVQSLKELDLTKALAVARAASMLDVHSWFAFLEARTAGLLHDSPIKAMADALAGMHRRQAIDRLLETRCLAAELTKITSELLALESEEPQEKLVGYSVPEFGRAIAEYTISELGLRSRAVGHRRITRRGRAPCDLTRLGTILGVLTSNEA